MVVGLSLLATALGQAGPKPESAPAAATRIAVCGVGTLFEHCRQSGDLNAELQDRRMAIQTEDDKRAKAAENVRMELQGLKPGSSEYESRLDELEKMQIEHKSWRESQMLRLERWHLRKTKEVYEKIIDAVARVAKDRGIQIVLDMERQELVGDDLGSIFAQVSGRKVLYSEPSVDLTGAVMARLNEEYRAKRP